MSRTNTILTVPEPGRVELVEKPFPKIKPGYALVKVEIAPICIEDQIYKDHTFEQFDDQENMGHEAVGYIAEVAEGSSFKVGDRVAVFPHHGCDGKECFVCRGPYSHSHCLTNPLEETEGVTDDPHSPVPALGGEPFLYGPGFMKIVERINESESGGFRHEQYTIQAERHIMKIPDELPFRYAALAFCSLGATFTGSQELGVEAGDTVLITGAGFMAQSCLINAKYRNAKVIVIARNKARVEICKKLGADLIIHGEDPEWKEKIHEFTGEYKGADFAFECSGFPGYQRKALEGLRRYGKIYMIGFNPHQHSFEIDFLYDVMNRHIWITAGHDGNDSFRGKIIRMLMDPEVQRRADIMITGEYNMSDAEESFKSLLTKTQGKHFLYPQENLDEYKANPRR